MIASGQTYVVMGLLDSQSIAYAIGKTIEALGGKIIYTVQSERMKKIFLDRSRDLEDGELAKLDIRFCDITVEEEVRKLFSEIGEVSGIVHSIAYANPKTCLGQEFHTDAIEDLKLSFHISAVSLATVARHAVQAMPHGGGIAALTFDSEKAYPAYNWMGVNKAALEATVRGLARRHGKDLIRVNAVSAGPLYTKAASAIPGFSELDHMWQESSPIPWDPRNDKVEVANAVAFLIGPYSKKITGQVLHVDGGVSIIGSKLMPWERRETTPPATA
jgi:meromycolic acid enoyl-[acyl-carrier-protein] reductase